MALLFANNSSLANITALPASVSGGGLNLIKTQTASASASISFVNGVDGVVLDGTYKEYIFKYINCHPSASIPHWTFQGSTNSGSSYGVTITCTAFNAYHAENEAEAVIEYSTGGDLAQSTSYPRLLTEVNNSNDGSVSGTLQLFNPSSTTYVKHFIANSQGMFGTTNAYSWNMYTAGYFNTTSAINGIDFKFSSGNIDDGIIKLYGVS